MKREIYYQDQTSRPINILLYSPIRFPLFNYANQGSHERTT